MTGKWSVYISFIKPVKSYFLTLRHGNVIRNSLFRIQAGFIARFHAVYPLTPPVTSILLTRSSHAIILTSRDYRKTHSV